MIRFLPRFVLVMLSAMILTACETTRTIVIDTSCEVYEPVRFSAKHDTPETVAQVRKNNAAYDALKCPQKNAQDKSQTGARTVDKF